MLHNLCVTCKLAYVTLWNGPVALTGGTDSEGAAESTKKKKKRRKKKKKAQGMMCP